MLVYYVSLVSLLFSLSGFKARRPWERLKMCGAPGLEDLGGSWLSWLVLRALKFGMRRPGQAFEMGTHSVPVLSKQSSRCRHAMHTSSLYVRGFSCATTFGRWTPYFRTGLRPCMNLLPPLVFGMLGCFLIFLPGSPDLTSISYTRGLYLPPA